MRVVEFAQVTVVDDIGVRQRQAVKPRGECAGFASVRLLVTGVITRVADTAAAPAARPVFDDAQVTRYARVIAPMVWSAARSPCTSRCHALNAPMVPLLVSDWFCEPLNVVVFVQIRAARTIAERALDIGLARSLFAASNVYVGEIRIQRPGRFSTVRGLAANAV
jgi:hypothetical protein